MNKPLKILRYNTGNDKQAFVKFKDKFDTVIFNAAIVAYSGSAVADLVSVHKRQYIIDPQTHIFQHDLSAIQSQNKKTKEKQIKKSILKYLDEMPEKLRDIIVKELRPLNLSDLRGAIKEFTSAVYKFETEYVNTYITNKEYDKYLKFAGVGPEPQLIIAPYFMLKKDYAKKEMLEWLQINRQCLDEYIIQNNAKYQVAAQLVLDKDVLLSSDYIQQIKTTYNREGFEYLFVWIDNFSSFDANEKERRAFYSLLCSVKEINKKPIMAYGGYDSILLCNRSITNKLYGVAQSVGYGESRDITPVGGGLPVNKYYFYPIHRRVRFDEAAAMLSEKGYFSRVKSSSGYAQDYYKNICDCNQCKDIIKNNIDNFNQYNESIPFVMKGRYGDVSRNRPTTNANLIAAMHFLFCKIREWDEIIEKDKATLIEELLSNIKLYYPQAYKDTKAWCELYAK